MFGCNITVAELVNCIIVVVGFNIVASVIVAGSCVPLLVAPTCFRVVVVFVSMIDGSMTVVISIVGTTTVVGVKGPSKILSFAEF